MLKIRNIGAAALIAVSMFVCGLSIGCAADEEASAATMTVPEKGTVEEYKAFIEKVISAKPEKAPETREEMMEMFKNRFPIMAQAAEKMMADKDISDEDFLSAAQIRIQAVTLTSDGDKDAVLATIDKMIGEAKKAGKEKALNQLEMMSLFSGLQAAMEEGEESLRAAVKKVEDKLAEKEKLEAQDYQLLAHVAGMAAYVSDNLALELYTKYAAKAREVNAEMAAVLYEKPLRRLQLLGSELKIAGKLLDGTPIDMAAKKGKVVLVDFWATWCGPCVAEVPNMVAMYKKYHDKGFEIIGITLDDEDKKDKLENFLKENDIAWEIMFDIDTEVEGETMSEYYAVEGIPTMFLVGKDGKVISTNARGEALKRLLEEQFPE